MTVGAQWHTAGDARNRCHYFRDMKPSRGLTLAAAVVLIQKRRLTVEFLGLYYDAVVDADCDKRILILNLRIHRKD